MRASSAKVRNPTAVEKRDYFFLFFFHLFEMFFLAPEGSRMTWHSRPRSIELKIITVNLQHKFVTVYGETALASPSSHPWFYIEIANGHNSGYISRNKGGGAFSHVRAAVVSASDRRSDLLRWPRDPVRTSTAAAPQRSNFKEDYAPF